MSSPREREYPFEIAAKMARDIKYITQDEAGHIVTETKFFYDLCNEQAATINGLKKELALAEQTVKLLQVEDS